MGSVFQVGSDFLLNQGLASFFSKGPNNKYFRLRRPYGLSQLFHSTYLCGAEAAKGIWKGMSVSVFQ